MNAAAHFGPTLLDKALAARQILAGAFWINTFIYGFSELPYGGGKQSGLGRAPGRNSLLDNTEQGTPHIHTGRRTSWWLSPKS